NAFPFPLFGDEVVVELTIHLVVVVFKDEFPVPVVGIGNVSVARLLRRVAAELSRSEDRPDSEVFRLLPERRLEEAVIVGPADFLVALGGGAERNGESASGEERFDEMSGKLGRVKMPGITQPGDGFLPRHL